MAHSTLLGFGCCLLGISTATAIAIDVNLMAVSILNGHIHISVMQGWEAK